MARPAYKAQPAPKVVSYGTVSKPKTPPWRPKAQPAPRRVTSPQTIV